MAQTQRWQLGKDYQPCTAALLNAGRDQQKTTRYALGLAGLDYHLCRTGRSKLAAASPART